MPERSDANQIDDDLGTDDLSIPPLKLPDHWATIPEHLVAGLGRRDRQIVEMSHVMAQQIEWVCSRLIEVNEHMRRQERMFLRMRNWRRFVMSKWSFILYVALLISPLIVSKLLEYGLGKLGGK